MEKVPCRESSWVSNKLFSYTTPCIAPSLGLITVPGMSLSVLGGTTNNVGRSPRTRQKERKLILNLRCQVGGMIPRADRGWTGSGISVA